MTVTSGGAPAEETPQHLDDPDVPRHDVPLGGRSGFTIVAGDRQVHYLEWGRCGAPHVVCLHGGGQTAYMYEELGAALAPTHHVLAPDLPNHGDSDALPRFDVLTGRRALAASLVPVFEQFGIEKAVVVGASLGGITGITLGAAHPDLFAGLVLIDVGHRLEEEGVLKIMEFMRAHESFASLEDAAHEISRYLPQRREVRPQSLTRNLRQLPNGRWTWKHGLGRRARLAEAEDRPTNWRSILEGLDTDAAALRCPTLVLRGVLSDVLSDEGAEEVTAVIPNATLKRVDKAGHLAAGDNPESTVGLVKGFLDEIGW